MHSIVTCAIGEGEEYTATTNYLPHQHCLLYSWESYVNSFHVLAPTVFGKLSLVVDVQVSCSFVLMNYLGLPLAFDAQSTAIADHSPRPLCSVKARIGLLLSHGGF